MAPRSVYGVARLEQEFGPAASTASLMVTTVHRDLAEGDPLAARLVRNALSVNGDSLLRFKGGEYELGLQGGLSYIDGDPAALLLVQRASVRYFQRPDADYVTLDPTRSRMLGAKGGVQLERQSGRHWLWSVRMDMESPELEVNDLGRLVAGDGVMVATNLSFRETVPGRLFRAYSVGGGTTVEWNYGGDRQPGSLRLNSSVTWPNFWRTNLSGSFDVRSQNWRLTRGGPSMATPRGWRVNGSLSNSSASATGWDGRVNYGRHEDGGLDFSVSGNISVRPGPRWELSVGPSYQREFETQQYVTALNRTGPETFGERYVFAFIDRSTIVAQLRLNYTFKPDLTLDIYAEPFTASGNFFDHGELAAARTRDHRLYGTDGTQVETLTDGSLVVTDGPDTFTLPNRDFNVVSFRSNVVLRWEWRPGSTLFAVWQQDRFSSLTSDERVTGGDLFSSINAPGDNVFLIKASFWIPVN